MRKRIVWIVAASLLTVGAVVCVVRWKAWFSNPEEPEWRGPRIQYHVHTFAALDVPGFRYDGLNWRDTNDPDELRFIVLGDVHNKIDSNLWSQVYNRHQRLDFYAQLGDFLDRGYDYYVQMLCHQLAGTGFDRLPVLTTPGNHEYTKGLVRRLPELWYKLFPQPHNGPSRMLGTTYYVDFEGLRFIVIDTNGLQRLSDYTRANYWAKKTIREANGRYTVVMMHHPVYSIAKGRFCPMIWLTFHRALAEADVVFTGHDHNYYRRMPYIGINAGGRPHAVSHMKKADMAMESDHLYEYVVLSHDTLRLQTLSMESGEVLDQAVITHRR